MKAYQIKTHFLIETENNFYFFWWQVGDYIVDQFDKDKIEFVKVIYIPNDEKVRLPSEKNIKVVQNYYRNREKYPTFNPKQFLTHQNKLLRKIIGNIVNESIQINSRCDIS